MPPSTSASPTGGGIEQGHAVRTAPSSFGRRAFIAGVAGGLAGATLLSNSVAAAVEPGASFFESLAPQRLCDTRSRPNLPAGFGYTRLDDRTIRVSVAGNGSIPADGVAAVLTVTGVNFGTETG